MELCKYCNKPLLRNQKVVRAKGKMTVHMLSTDINKRLLYLIKQKDKFENEIHDIITKRGIIQKQLKEYQDCVDKLHEEETE